MKDYYKTLILEPTPFHKVDYSEPYDDLDYTEEELEIYAERHKEALARRVYYDPLVTPLPVDFR